MVVALFLLLLVTTGAALGNVNTGDTDNLVKGTRHVLACLDDRTLVGCGHTDGVPHSDVFPYPLLQYIPSLAMVWLGLSDERILDALARLNSVAFIGSLALVALLARRVATFRLWMPELLVVLLAGPLLYYATAGFGEMLVACSALAFVASVLARRPLLAGALLAVACLGKETLPPFLFALGLICAREDDDGWLPAKPWLVALFVGAATGMALNVGFNVFRFGSPFNLTYLQPEFRTPGVRLPLRFFAALWGAPNGGLAWFWSTAFLCLLVVGVVATRSLVRRPHDVRVWLPPVSVLLIFVAFQAGLAFWPYPFGWIAWGPRLSVVLVPAVVLAALHTGGPPVRAAFDAVIRPRAGAVAVGLVVVLAALPHAGAVWNYGDAVWTLLAPDEVCDPLRGPLVPNDVHFRCLEHMAWRTSHWSLVSSLGIDRGDGRLAAGILAVGAALLIVVARARVLGRTTAVAVDRTEATAPGVDSPRQGERR